MITYALIALAWLTLIVVVIYVWIQWPRDY